MCLIAIFASPPARPLLCLPPAADVEEGYSRVPNGTQERSMPLGSTPVRLLLSPARLLSADIEELTQPVPVDGRFTADAATTQVRRAAARRRP